MNNAHLEMVTEQIRKILKIESKLAFGFHNGSTGRDLKLEQLFYFKSEPNTYLNVCLLLDKRIISSFSLQQLPGCCGICVSFHNNIDPKFRGNGLNVILNNFRIELARYLGYTILMCTDVHNNIPQKKTLIKNGWQDIFRFRNKRTDNLVDISIVQL